MATLFASVATYTVLGVLLLATADHLASPRTLPRALTAHGMLPKPTAVATGVIVVEMGLAVLAVLAVSDLAADRLRAPVLAAAALLFAGHGGYTQLVKSSHPGSPCGCSRSELPVTGWVVARACLLAAVALVASQLSDSVLTLDRFGAPLAVALLAAATFSGLLWHLPEAMHQPTTTRPVGYRHGDTHPGKGAA